MREELGVRKKGVKARKRRESGDHGDLPVRPVRGQQVIDPLTMLCCEEEGGIAQAKTSSGARRVTDLRRKEDERRCSSKSEMGTLGRDKVKECLGDVLPDGRGWGKCIGMIREERM